MNIRMKNIFTPMMIILSVLIVLEVISTAFFPIMGLIRYRIPFNILIILYFGFRLETPWLPVMILGIQFFHSFFTIEGWASGTIAGVLVSLIISYLKDMIHFSSTWGAIFVTQIFQTLWFVIVSILIYIRNDNFVYIVDKFWRFIPESLFISLVAPPVFIFFDKIFKKDQLDMLKGGGLDV